MHKKARKEGLCTPSRSFDFHSCERGGNRVTKQEVPCAHSDNRKLSTREKQLAKLSEYNSYYAYEYYKNYPDPSQIGDWARYIAFELEI